jgi:hypothetical protein
MSLPSDRSPPFAWLLMGAWVVAALQLIISGWAVTAETLMDTDDAMRLVEVREFLAGKAWYDLNQPRVEPPHGLWSHWSRLIDAGLAGLYLLFRPFVDAPLAERLMRATWPLLWLLPTIAGASAIAWRLGGREAAIVALLFAAIGLPAFQQFNPGRVDHHNVQIALSVAILACAVWSAERRAAAIGAGLLSGFLLAIGFEAIGFVVLAGAAITLRFAVTGQGAQAAADYGWSLAAATALGFLLTPSTPNWVEAACDAIAINVAWPVTIGGLVLFLAARRYAERGRAMRLFAVASAGAVALSMFLIIEPMCLKGPFAFVDPALKPIWLDKVNEVQPLLKVVTETPVTGAGVLAHPLIALVAMLWLAFDRDMRRSFAFLLVVLGFALAFVMTLSMIRSFSYLVWIGLPVAAAGVMQLFARFHLQRLAPRALIAFLVTPAVASAAAITAAEAMGHASAAKDANADKKACFATANYAQLAALPKGIMAAPVDLGPHLLAHTPHTVLAAPYHRLSSGILASTRIFADPPEESRRILVKVGATYLVTCGGKKTDGPVEASVRKTLLGHLLAGDVPAWLEPVEATVGQRLVAYRVKAK